MALLLMITLNNNKLFMLIIIAVLVTNIWSEMKPKKNVKLDNQSNEMMFLILLLVYFSMDAKKKKTINKILQFGRKKPQNDRKEWKKIQHLHTYVLYEFVYFCIAAFTTNERTQYTCTFTTSSIIL